MGGDRRGGEGRGGEVIRDRECEAHRDREGKNSVTAKPDAAARISILEQWRSIGGRVVACPCFVFFFSSIPFRIIANLTYRRTPRRHVPSTRSFLFRSRFNVKLGRESRPPISLDIAFERFEERLVEFVSCLGLLFFPRSAHLSRDDVCFGSIFYTSARARCPSMCVYCVRVSVFCATCRVVRLFGDRRIDDWLRRTFDLWCALAGSSSVMGG